MGDIEKIVDGHWEKTPDLHHIKRTISIENLDIPVLSLEYEAEAYMKFGRLKKANILYNYIKNAH